MWKKIVALAICLVVLVFAGCGGNSNINQSSLDKADIEQEKKIYNGYTWGALEQKGKDDDVYCNLPENVNGLDNMLLVCHDPKYDILYYVNYGVDYLIYGCRDGETEKIADIPAKRLFCRDGKLYFIAESYGMDSLDGLDGQIFEYDPVTGQILTIMEEQVTSMMVYQDGIYCTIDEMKELGDGSFLLDRVVKYYSFFDEKMIVLQDISGVVRTLYRCGQDFLFYVIGSYQGEDEELLKMAEYGKEINSYIGMKLGDLNMMNEKALDNLLVLNDFYATDDKIYYVQNMENDADFVVYSIDSKLESRYPLSSLEQGAYIVFDDCAYFSDLTGIDLKNGKQLEFFADEYCDILEWYSDGVNLYGLCNILRDGDIISCIRKIEIQAGHIQFIPLTEAI